MSNGTTTTTPTDPQIQDLTVLWLLAVACTDADSVIFQHEQQVRTSLGSFSGAYDFLYAYMTDTNQNTDRAAAGRALQHFKNYAALVATKAGGPPPPNPWGGGGNCPITADNIVALLKQLS
jgi:hypothetical protein